MANLIDHLKAFNRKERFILLNEALGFHGHSFCMSANFSQRLSDCLGFRVPENAFVAMDYHLDWLQMALWLADHADTEATFPNEGLVFANQQDIDLLVAFEGETTTRLILIEAKGDTDRSQDQLDLKCARLELIFGRGRPGTSRVTPDFILMSPEKPTRMDTTSWPSWMKVNGKARWLELRLPDGLLKVSRCTRAGGSSADGTYLKIFPI